MPTQSCQMPAARAVGRSLAYPEPVVRRFRALLRPEGKCEIWAGPREGFRLNGENLSPKAVAWEISGRTVEDPVWLIQQCETPGCVAAAHHRQARLSARPGFRHAEPKARGPYARGERPRLPKLADRPNRNLYMQAGVIRYQRVLCGERINVSMCTSNWKVARWRRDEFELEHGLGRSAS